LPTVVLLRFWRVWPRLHLSDDRVRENIDRGLFWNPFVRGDHVKVAVDGGW